MKSGVIVACLLLALGAGNRTVGAQQPAAQQPSEVELYHVQFVKAAPGKLAALIDAQLKAPPYAGATEPPVIFRHVQGDDWQLMIISPMGKEHTIRAELPTGAEQQFITQMRGLSTRHDDSLTLGPPWAQAKKVLLGNGQPGAVYIVSTFEPVPGQRQELLKALREGPNAEPASTLILQHREGAAWQLLTITRYDSWAALGEAMERQRKQRPGVPTAQEHIAAHRDTVVERVVAPVR